MSGWSLRRSVAGGRSAGAGSGLRASDRRGAQVCWTRLAAALDTAWITRPESHGLCPVCGSPPVAGIVRIGDADHGLRYLHCALCGTEWHVVRAPCSHYDNDKGIVYYT